MPRYFEIEVTLVLPRRVWRRFLIQKSASFAELHLAIQAAFGWQNYHLFEFRHPGKARRVFAGIPDEDAPYTPDARQERLSDRVANPYLYGATWFEYEYDFGDGWIHEVKVRDEVSLPEKFKRRMLEGERAGPPEDCGGEGYERIVSVVENGIDPFGELATIREWIGNWTPETFDLDALRKHFDLSTGAKKTRFVDN